MSGSSLPSISTFSLTINNGQLSIDDCPFRALQESKQQREADPAAVSVNLADQILQLALGDVSDKAKLLRWYSQPTYRRLTADESDAGDFTCGKVYSGE
jgi:hypothetical protein